MTLTRQDATAIMILAAVAAGLLWLYTLPDPIRAPEPIPAPEPPQEPPPDKRQPIRYALPAPVAPLIKRQ